MIDVEWKPAEFLDNGAVREKYATNHQVVSVTNESGHVLIIQYDETGRHLRILSKLENDE